MTARNRRRGPDLLSNVTSKLSPRDRDLLRFAAETRMACTRQFERAFFTTATPLANARHCRRSLQKLVDLGLLARLERRVGGVRSGSAGYVYSLGVIGQHLMENAGEIKPRKPWTPSMAFVRHRLAITELRVQLIEANREGDIELASFQSEPSCWRSFTGPHGARAWLKPDAAAVTAAGDYEDRWLVEIDMATQSPMAIARKLAAYDQYRRSGREQSAHGVFPMVLFVVPSEARQRVLYAAIGKQSASVQEVTRVTTASEAVTFMAGGAS